MTGSHGAGPEEDLGCCCLVGFFSFFVFLRSVDMTLSLSLSFVNQWQQPPYNSGHAGNC